MSKKAKHQDNSTLYVVLGTVVFALVLIVVAVVSAQQQKNKPASADLVVGSEPHARGAEQPKVTLSVFSDFTCSHCQAFSQEVGTLLDSFPDSLKFVHRYYLLGGETSPSEFAAEANEAAGAQGKYWEYQKLLWDNFGKITRDELITYARTLGLDIDKFTADLDGRVYRARVVQDYTDGKALGITGTPTIYLNGKKHEGSYSIESLTTAIQALLDAQPQP